MALTLPTTDELAVFQHVEEVEDEDWAADALETAADLLEIASGTTDDPTDERGLRIVKRGILDMAWFLLVQTANREEMYSPFSSERIGSYSYSKVTQAAREGQATGVGMFDFAVKYLRNLDEVEGGYVYATYENVVNPDEQTFAEQEQTATWLVPDIYGP